MVEPLRTLVLWCPDWPITASVQVLRLPAGAPLALIDRGLVFASSAAARREGVRRGLRIREAQSRCTELIVRPYDAAIDARAFEPVLDALEEVIPHVQLVRPGVCAVRVSGPARYYGSEQGAAEELLRRVDALDIDGARIGIADGPFTAEQAARRGAGRVSIVKPGSSPSFLAPLPVTILGQAALASLLRRLGISTLGAFAALPPEDVLARFGPDGVRSHLLASGLDARRVIPRTPPDDFDRIVEFEPPLDRIDQVTFGFRAAADEFLEHLSAAKLVCTAIRIEVDAEGGERSERSWLHPRSFTVAEVVDRVRWQLQGAGTIDSGIASPIARIRVVPETVDAASNHEEGLWGSGPEERVHHGLSRVQSMLGHTAVVTVTIGGGRLLADRRVLVPWGNGQKLQRPADRPWPGSLTGLTPSTVFAQPRAAVVLSPTGSPVLVDERGSISGPPTRFAVAASANTAAGSPRELTAWAGPWPLMERWWDAAEARTLNRFQVVDADGMAWLLVLEADQWRAEGRYD